MSKSKEKPIGLQRKEFSAKVGLTERQVLRYCELGVFNPLRPAGAPNDRRYFTESDFKVAELIHILSKLGLNPIEIGRIFSEQNHDLNQILDLAIDNLKKRMVHDRNLAIAAEYAQAVGTSLFSFGNMTDSDIDKIAQAIRDSQEYKTTKRILRKLSAEKRKELSDQLISTIEEFSALSDILDTDDQLLAHFQEIEMLASRLISVHANLGGTDSHFSLLTLAGIYANGDGLLCAQADQIGGAGTAELIGTCLFLVGFKRVARLLFPLVTLLDNAEMDSHQKDDALEHLSLLLDARTTPDTSINELTNSNDAKEALIELVGMTFEFAVDISTDQDVLLALGIDRELVPTEKQFQSALASISDYVRGTTGKGKGSK